LIAAARRGPFIVDLAAFADGDVLAPLARRLGEFIDRLKLAAQAAFATRARLTFEGGI
jgi:hypothetical protein